MTSCKSLIIRNLASAVTEDALGLIFGHIAPVESLSIITTLQSAVIEFQEHRGAEQALISMNKRPLAGQVIQIEWNYENGKIAVRHPTMTQDSLKQAFEKWNATDVTVTKDKKGMRGVVSFPTAMQAELAAFKMQGQPILSFPIEIILDDDDGDGEESLVSEQSSTTESSEASLESTTYQDVFAKTPPYHTAIYIKKLPKNVSKHEIVFLLQQYGMINDMYLHTHKRRAIIK
ncbi:hypothetical protein BY458DRAFT_501450 [Sporodiniella umbellata]|nr:hypothetical protein BY458DRAFT_501450 [Sporodiniella umbellata]